MLAIKPIHWAQLSAWLVMIALALAATPISAQGENAAKYYRNGPGQNGEYFDTRTMRWYTANGQPCDYCTPQSGYGVPLDQINQGDQRKYAFADGYFFSPYELAWFDRSGECLRCDPSTGFWIPDEFQSTAEYRKERRRFAQFLTGVTAPQPDGRPANVPRLGALGQGFNANLPLRFDPRQMRWIDQAGQVCPVCTPENGYWIPPQFSREPEYQAEQQRYAGLIGTMRRELPPQTGTGAFGGDSIECSSDKGRYKLCRTDTGRGVELVERLSRTECVQNQSWGFSREGIWVDRGCRARFRVIR